jgi:hypothetical protein
VRVAVGGGGRWNKSEFESLAKASDIKKLYVRVLRATPASKALPLVS